MEMKQLEMDFGNSGHRMHANSLAEWFDGVKDTLKPRQQAVIGALIRMGGQGTPKEVAAFLNVPLHTISGRFTELKDLGIVAETGKKRMRSSEVEVVRR